MRRCSICGMPLSMYNHSNVCFHHNEHPKKRVHALKEERDGMNASPWGSALPKDPEQGVYPARLLRDI